MTYHPITPDPPTDTAVTTALTALAALLLAVLEPWGIGQSIALGTAGVDVAPETGPFAVHTIAPGEHAITWVSECQVRIAARVHTWLLLAPAGSDRAAALTASVDWLIPVLRAVIANVQLDGTAEYCLPVSWSVFSAATWASMDYTGLLVTHDLAVRLTLPVQD